MLGAARRAAAVAVRLQSALRRDASVDGGALIHSVAGSAARGGIASTRHAAVAPSWADALRGTVPSQHLRRTFADDAKQKKAVETCVIEALRMHGMALVLPHRSSLKCSLHATFLPACRCACEASAASAAVTLPHITTRSLPASPCHRTRQLRGTQVSQRRHRSLRQPS